jgi:uncharacterized protein YutE (UPF0331/DUF86 family)
MLDKAFVRHKLNVLVENLNELAPLADMTLAEYRADYVRRHAAEKLIELAIENSSDVNRHLVESVGRTTPPSYYSSFEELAHLRIISAALARKLAATTGLPNRLVHGYETVDHKLVHQALKPLVRDYRKYVVAIEKYVLSVP